MSEKYSLLFIILLSSVCYCCKSSEKIILTDQHMVNQLIEKVKIDKLGNVFVLDKSNELFMYTPDLKQKYTYADNTLGKISNIDVSDPLKMVIYKQDYGQVIVLDNTLAEINRLNLFEMGFQGISVVSTALDGNLWAYDIADYKLKKLSPQGKILLESMNMVDLGLQRLQPDFLQEKQGKLVVKDPDVGILLFDNLGQFIQTFPFKVDKDIQFDGTNIIFLENDKLVQYNTQLYEESTRDISGKSNMPSPINVKVGKSGTYYIYKNGIDYETN